MDRKGWIAQRLEYLDYITHKLRKKSPLKFSEWIIHTLHSLNKTHSNIHIKARRLKQIIRDLT